MALWHDAQHIRKKTYKREADDVGRFYSGKRIVNFSRSLSQTPLGIAAAPPSRLEITITITASKAMISEYLIFPSLPISQADNLLFDWQSANVSSMH